MKVSEAIERASAIYPELASDGRVYAWLSEIEERVATELAKEEFAKITSVSGNSVLLVPDYLSELYPLYLVTQADIANSDHSRYVCHNSAFLSAYAEAANYFNRIGNGTVGSYYRF